MMRFSGEQNIIVGQITEEYFRQLQNYDWVEQELNAKSCFDFEYEYSYYGIRLSKDDKRLDK